MIRRLSLLLTILGFACSVALAAQKPAGKAAGPGKPAGKAVSGKTEETREPEAKPADSSPAKDDTNEKTGGPKAKSTPSQSQYISVVKERPGQNTLVVSYLWKAHQNASIEVRLVPSERAEKVTVSPLYFFSEYFRGTNRDRVYRCLKNAERGEKASFLKDKTEFRILGERNSLGHAAVTVLPFNPKAPGERKDEDLWSSPTALFPLLDAWAVDQHTLCLDLPHDVSYKSEKDEFERRMQAFSQPGKLYVWFLRSEKVLWQDTLEWPGM